MIQRSNNNPLNLFIHPNPGLSRTNSGFGQLHGSIKMTFHYPPLGGGRIQNYKKKSNGGGSKILSIIPSTQIPVQTISSAKSPDFAALCDRFQTVAPLNFLQLSLPNKKILSIFSSTQIQARPEPIRDSDNYAIH
jgi:hypothetical protein